MNYYLAVDIGASSGRHILGHIENGKLKLEEIYRFENGLQNVGGSLCWDIEALTKSVIEGIAVCKKIGKIPTTVAIDTWGVDYVLLDENDKEMLPVYSYRDSRTDNAVAEVEKIIPRYEMFERTGIQPIKFNTIYQLYCDKQSGKLTKAKHILMIPDYLSYKLTGVFSNEYTVATTGALVNAKTNEFDFELLEKLGIKKELFSPIAMPGTYLADFSEEIKEKVGFDAKVVHAPSHDTASAVLACPIDDKSVYISSGTWSLIGSENKEPVLTSEVCDAGFTNEGGAEYKFRFLENIIGMWFFQNIKKNLNGKYSYDEIMNMAMESQYDKCIDPNDKTLVAPENMIEAIRKLLGDENLPIGDVAKSVYISLAHSYDTAVKTIERFSNKTVENIMIVGGGSKDTYLNKLTEEITGKKVLTGLSEATATGNILSQIMYCENIDVKAAREIVKNSFEIK